MNILILGGDGFIGSHLRKAHLLRGDDVTIVDINNYRTGKDLIDCDLAHNTRYTIKCNMDLWVNGKTPDFVYNCVAVATPSYYVKYPEKTFDLDFTVNKEIIDTIDSLNIPLVHFSTSEVYGKTWSEPYTEESDCVLGPATKSRWIYATSKILLDQYILARGIDCCIIRPFNFIGHDLDWLPDIHKDVSTERPWIPRVPSCFLNALLSSKPMTIVRPGSQKRCYTYIDDAAQGIISIVDNWSKCRGEILNIGNPNNETTIDGLAYLMSKSWLELTGEEPKSPIYVDGVDLYGKGYEDSERRLFSDEKMKRLTGWEAQIDLDTTIDITVKAAKEEYTL
jgi:UDP-apiose/xylose synthase